MYSVCERCRDSALSRTVAVRFLLFHRARLSTYGTLEMPGDRNRPAIAFRIGSYRDDSIVTLVYAIVMECDAELLPYAVI